MGLENSAQLAGQAKKKRKASGGSSWANAAWMKAWKESQVNERPTWIELQEIDKLSCVIQTLPLDSSKIFPKMVSIVCLLNVPTKTLSVLIWRKNLQNIHARKYNTYRCSMASNLHSFITIHIWAYRHYMLSGGGGYCSVLPPLPQNIV